MKITKRKIDRAAVAKSLRELDKLFGKKTPGRKGNDHGQVVVGDTGNLTSRGAL